MIERGYCRSREFVQSLRESGVTEKHLYQDGRAAENLDRCLSSFRGRPGRLLIAPDLRVFGASKKAVAEVMARLERARIQVVDVIHPQHETIAEMMQYASVLISGTRFRDRRTARRRGAEGGRAKGQAAVEARSSVAPDWLVQNIVAAPEISWKVKLRLLDGWISEATLRRHYRVPA